MYPEPGYVVLELRVEQDQVTEINIAKWTRITNYAYIPLDEDDEKEHVSLLQNMGISSVKAVMTQFYPEIKSKIIASWDRLFDDSVSLGSTNAYGRMWEVRKEWVQKTIV